MFTEKEITFLKENGFNLYPEKSDKKFYASRYSNGIVEHIEIKQYGEVIGIFESRIDIRYENIFKGNFQIDESDGATNSFTFRKNKSTLDQAMVSLEELKQEIRHELKNIIELL